MFTLTANGVNDALPAAWRLLHREGVSSDSRNGPVLTLPRPACIEYRRPWERVLFLPERDHNPFFAFFETLWMFQGRDDLEYLLPFNSNMAQYSDDGELVRGSAYGRRWRSWFGHDQLNFVLRELNNSHDSRRAVLGMWDSATDSWVDSRDIPCNLCVVFRVRNGKLDMTVYNRSNDLLFGAMGSNVVHFSMLQELVAGLLRVEMGSYYQVANDLHVYTETPVYKKLVPVMNLPTENPYEGGDDFRCSIFSPGISPDDWLIDVDVFMCEEYAENLYDHPHFFLGDALPMLRAHECWRIKDDPSRFDKAIAYASQIRSPDWRRACAEWLLRRKRRAEEKKSV